MMEVTLYIPGTLNNHFSCNVVPGWSFPSQEKKPGRQNVNRCSKFRAFSEELYIAIVAAILPQEIGRKQMSRRSTVSQLGEQNECGEANVEEPRKEPFRRRKSQFAPRNPRKLTWHFAPRSLPEPKTRWRQTPKLKLLRIKVKKLR